MLLLRPGRSLPRRPCDDMGASARSGMVERELEKVFPGNPAKSTLRSALPFLFSRPCSMGLRAEFGRPRPTSITRTHLAPAALASASRAVSTPGVVATM